MDNILTELIKELETMAKELDTINRHVDTDRDDAFENIGKAEGYRHVIEIIKAKIKKYHPYHTPGEHQE